MCDQNLSFLTFDDDFRTQKVLAGEQVWETLAVQRTSIVCGITAQPWAPSAYRINCVVVQLEKHLNVKNVKNSKNVNREKLEKRESLKT